MNITEAIQAIEALIREFGQELSEEDYMEALSEMSERSTDAYNAHSEETGEKD